ncbi:9387_t:CDS:2 [Gigaspora rosea]|nr:9387_t:CDS:2 [Gigaspora rosea]
MMEANKYINQTYPPINRTSIKILDVSSKNLTNTINLGPSDNFTSILELNASFNQINNFNISQLSLQTMDFSHNNLINFSMYIPSALEIINLSHNSLSDIGPISDILTHLDISNNLLTYLDLHNYKHLVSLNCSANPDLSNLTLNSYFDPSDSSAFDCRGTNLGKINTTSFTFDCQTGSKTIKKTVPDTHSPITPDINFYTGIIIDLRAGKKVNLQNLPI